MRCRLAGRFPTIEATHSNHGVSHATDINGPTRENNRVLLAFLVERIVFESQDGHR